MSSRLCSAASQPLITQMYILCDCSKGRSDPLGAEVEWLCWRDTGVRGRKQPRLPHPAPRICPLFPLYRHQPHTLPPPSPLLPPAALFLPLLLPALPISHSSLWRSTRVETPGAGTLWALPAHLRGSPWEGAGGCEGHRGLRADCCRVRSLPSRGLAHPPLPVQKAQAATATGFN